MPVPRLPRAVVPVVAAILFISCDLSGLVLAAEPAGPSSIWEGTSGNLHIEWTTEDIRAQRAGTAGQPMFSLVRRLRASFDRDDTARRNEEARTAAQAKTRGESASLPNPCVTTSRVSLLSVVGTIASARVTSTTSCEREAHPAGETRFLVLDLAPVATANAQSAATAKAVTLTDYFPPSAVFEALRKDSVVRQALQASNSQPANLAQLLEALAAAPPVMDATHCYAFPDDLLSRFAFHHREGGQMAVRLAVPGAGPCRENLTQIGLLLPIPQALGRSVTAAESREAGFLMRDADSIAKGRQTAATFHSAP